MSITILKMAVIKGPNISVTYMAIMSLNQVSPARTESSTAMFKVSPLISSNIACMNICESLGGMDRAKPIVVVSSNFCTFKRVMTYQTA